MVRIMMYGINHAISRNKQVRASNTSNFNSIYNLSLNYITVTVFDYREKTVMRHNGGKKHEQIVYFYS